ncbi:hypothetical protein Ndes2526A_g06926 [Nannochloris sp. 'desiccata']
MTDSSSVRLDYVSAGCNRVVGALDWSEEGLIAYCAHHAIAIYDPATSSIVSTLLGHTDTVTCLRWFKASDFGGELNSSSVAADQPHTLALASGGGDGSVCIWLLIFENSSQPWTLAATLPAHKAAITSITIHNAGFPGQMVLVTTAGDGDVSVWSSTRPLKNPASLLSSEENWHLAQRLSYDTRLQHCSAITALPSEPNSLLLALGGVDGKVRLLLSSSQESNHNNEFKLVCELAGHQNWVRGLAFTHLKDGSNKFLLASASQDSGIAYQATLEALLIGHEDWVHSVAWKPRKDCEEDDESPCLLSASMDRTMVLWVPDKATGIWLSQESVGDAGVNHLGYYTGVWHPNGTSIVAHGFTGALHLWNRTENGDLIPQPAVGGHCNQIVDACWGVDGGCLLTVSTDQTARLTTKLKKTGKWCEIARPQVHGHDFSCVTALPSRRQEQKLSSTLAGGEGLQIKEADSRYLYVSGSEEKVLRVFEAPGAFADTLAMARGQPLPSQGTLAPSTPAYGASLPALGLSNKAIYTAEDASGGGGGGNVSGSAEPGLGEGGYNEYGPDVAPNAAPNAIAGPPLEEHLAGSTLWPEIHKLYGHGNEIYCVAAHPTGRYLASACRAQSTSTAGILMWDTKTWTFCANLEAHSLTVTQLAFSPNGKFLASASRDRTLAIFSSNSSSSSPDAAESDDTIEFSLVSHLKAHARIVWGIGWAPNSRLLATASRDGTAKIWHIDATTGCCIGNAAVATIQFDKIGVQCVAFAPKEVSHGKCLAAVGLENGEVIVGVVSWSEASVEETTSLLVEWSEIWRTPVIEKHAAAVRRICWRVVQEEGEDGAGGDDKTAAAAAAAVNFDLASVSDDHSIRIFNIDSSFLVES